MKTLLIFSLVFFASFTPFSQKKETSIQRIGEEVVIDGILNEAFWENAIVLSDFVQNTPNTGLPANQKTEVKIAYDNSAFYVGAMLYDSPDSISYALSQRDDFGNADWFGLIIDPYNSGTIGFSFLVTSAGVQIDELYQENNSSTNWNAIWYSKVKATENGWVTEIKIPFSALRFPRKDVQTWGINFSRNVRRSRERSYWSFFDPQGFNLLGQLGTVNGIKNIDSPIRLSFTPYVSGYIESYDGSIRQRLNGGMDLKYGLNEAFTIDMTLIPDFGQVQFDNQILNLTPFEVQFNENRQFFTEGTELFNKQNLFYSRRIGAEPIHYNDPFFQLDTAEYIVNNPLKTQLVNATKISGRTKKGTGIGVFNAVTKRMEATIGDSLTGLNRRVSTGPATNYNVFVIDQNLKNNSSITFTNTNVLRNGNEYDANVTGVGVSLFSKEQKYQSRGRLSVSQKYFNDSVEIGHNAFFSLAKTNGKFQWNASYRESSNTYDQNDLGFQIRNNNRVFNMRYTYGTYKPFWRLIKTWTQINVAYSQLINPNVFSEFSLNFKMSATFKNFLSTGFLFETFPIKNHDWFEARVDGRFYEKDESIKNIFFMSSDYSKPFAYDLNVSYTAYNESGRYDTEFFISPRFRINDRFALVINNAINIAKNNEGVALTTNFEIPLIDDNPLFAKRDRLTIINGISANYIFTNRMGLTFSLRHYWSKLTYNKFFLLNEAGRFEETIYTGVDDIGNSLHNNNYNAFTIDMAYRWVFAPGSELSLVWKNSIFTSSEIVNTNYFDNIRDVSNSPSSNSLSLKILYYIDYWETKQKLFKPQSFSE